MLNVTYTNTPPETVIAADLWREARARVKLDPNTDLLANAWLHAPGTAAGMDDQIGEWADMPVYRAKTHDWITTEDLMKKR